MKIRLDNFKKAGIILGVLVSILSITESLFDFSSKLFHRTEIEYVLISGRVLTKEYQPIKDALITIDGQHFSCHTKYDGTFISKLFIKQTNELITIRISHSDYKTVAKDIIISDNKYNLNDIFMIE
jgi:hypothetical protein